MSVAISGDTVVVGADGEDSSGTGVNGNQSDNSALNSGAAYVFVRKAGVWTQQAYLKASNTGGFDRFGNSVAVSGDTVVVGAPEEASDAKGVNGNQSDNSAEASGTAYLFVRNAEVWTQQAYLKASNTERYDVFGLSVAISGDTVVVGAAGEASGATGVNGNQTDNSAPISGAAYVFFSSNPADTTPPQIVPTITGTLGANGWYTSDVSVSWSVTDPESGIASFLGCTAQNLLANTAGTTLNCSAINTAGLSNSVSVTVKIDKSPPVLTGLAGAACSLWPPNHQLVQVAVVRALAGLSGLASFTVAAQSNEPENGVGLGDTGPDIVITGSGMDPRTVQLRAERSGTGTGRVYTIQATAISCAGMKATASARCVVPHDRGR